MTGVSVEDFALIMGAIAQVMSSLFYMLDSVPIAGFTLLDFIIAIEALGVLVWFILSFINIKQGDN